MACVVLTAIILVTNYAEEDSRTTGKLQSNEERAGCSLQDRMCLAELSFRHGLLNGAGRGGSTQEGRRHHRMNAGCRVGLSPWVVGSLSPRKTMQNSGPNYIASCEHCNGSDQERFVLLLHLV